MNKAVLKGFSDEMQKEALLPKFILKGLSPLKSWRAGMKGSKTHVRQIDRELRKIKFTDPKFDAGGYRVKRLQQLEEAGEKAGKAIEKSFTEGGKSIAGGQGIISRNKGKVLVGGAVAGGLLLASSSNTKDEQKRRYRASLRNMRIPQRAYY